MGVCSAVWNNIKVELYGTQAGLTQCYNCQNFGHVWANCKQPPQCMFCGGGHLHRECPEKTNTESMLSCCNCTLVEGEKPDPVSYRGCSRAKGELQRIKAQWAPKGSSGRTFFCRFTLPDQSYAAALCQDTQYQQPQALHLVVLKMFTTFINYHHRIHKRNGYQHIQLEWAVDCFCKNAHESNIVMCRVVCMMKWWVLVQMIGFIGTLVTISLNNI
jgi:hypothetical protein